MDGINSEGLRPAVKSFSCPGCGGIVELRAPGQSLSAVCQHCDRVIDVTDENFRIIQEAEQKTTIKPHIPLGSRGRIKNVLWEVTGFMVRRVPAYDFRWQEYLLFNPIHGYRWLTCINNHWSFISPVITPPAEVSGGVKYEDKEFKHFSGSVAEVNYVMGEFYWKVQKGQRVQMTDYICPPFAVSRETDADAKVWSHSEYMEPAVIKEAFKLTTLPEPTGVAYNQVNKYTYLRIRMGLVAFLALVLILIIQIVHSNTAPNKMVFTQQYVLQYAKDTSIVTQAFDVPGAMNNVEVILSTSLDNAWMEADGYLTREGSEHHYNFQMLAQYWRGPGWTEGSTKARTKISAIPGGKYELTLHIQSGEDPASMPPISLLVDAEVRRGVPFGSNFWLFGGLVFLPLFIVHILHRRFETRRKENA